MLKNRPDATEQPWKDFVLVAEHALAQMFHRTFLSVLTGSVSQTAYITFSLPALPFSSANTSSSKNFGTVHHTKASARFISCISDLFFQGPELLSKYVGESERAVREVRSHSTPPVKSGHTLFSVVCKRAKLQMSTKGIKW